MSEDYVIFSQPKLPIDLTRLVICYGWGAVAGKSGGHLSAALNGKNLGLLDLLVGSKWRKILGKKWLADLANLSGGEIPRYEVGER